MNLDLGISYVRSPAADNSVAVAGRNAGNSSNTIVSSYGNSPPCACGVFASSALPSSSLPSSSGPTMRPCQQQRHLAPENVLISIASWLIENPMLGGVLRVCRLKLPSAAVPSAGTGSGGGPQAVTVAVARSAAQLRHVVPLLIATSALGLDDEGAASSTKSSSTRGLNTGGGRSSCDCSLCGYSDEKHWADEDLPEGDHASATAATGLLKYRLSAKKLLKESTCNCHDCSCSRTSSAVLPSGTK